MRRRRYRSECLIVRATELEYVRHPARKKRNPAGQYPIPDRRRNNRVHDWKGFKRDPCDPLRPVRLDYAAELSWNRKPVHHFPGFGGGVHRARGTFFEAKRVIRVRMRNHNGTRLQLRKCSKPGFSAVDHDLAAAVSHQGCSMHVMSR